MLLWVAACTGASSDKVALSGSSDCAACHADEWLDTRAPPHAQAGFERACGACHDELGWAPAPGFSHSPTFALTLGHAGATCSECHRQSFAPDATSKACASCHGDRAAAVIDPLHAGLSTDCFACHRTDSFFPARFVHAWPLRGKHALTSCRSCHQAAPAARYEGTSPACLGCHQSDRARADQRASDHRAYAAECETCHGFESFIAR